MKLIQLIINIFKHRQDKFNNIEFWNENKSIRLRADTIYIIKSGQAYKWAKFMCPCRCGKEIVISLNSNIKPNWDVTVSLANGKNKVSFYPSIYMTGHKCKAHFFIRNNKILWV